MLSPVVLLLLLSIPGCIDAPNKLARPMFEDTDGDAGGEPKDVPNPPDLLPQETPPLDEASEEDVTQDVQGPETTGSDATELDAEASDAPEGDACPPDCADKNCGADGCGGLCGVCLFGEKCNSLQMCGPECDAQCEGKFCGPDGCGGTCGSCMESFQCGPDGKCYDVACTPDCEGKVCGGDGCGGSCGECALGDLCVEGGCVAGPCSGIPENGKCEDGVAYLCVKGEALLQNCLAAEGTICAWDPSLGHYACVVESECVTQCTDKDCGDDGCGGKCGVCPSGWPCEVGVCKLAAGGGCGYVTPVGFCEEAVLWYCGEDILYMQDCAAVDQSCGFVPSQGANQCIE